MTFVVYSLYLIYFTCPLNKRIPIAITYEIFEHMISLETNIEYIGVLKKMIDQHVFSYGAIYGLKSISYCSFLAINKHSLIWKSTTYPEEIWKFQPFGALLTEVESEERILENYDEIKRILIWNESSWGNLISDELKWVNWLLFKEIKGIIDDNV